MGYYEKLQQTANKLVTKRGVAVILRRKAKGAHNPSAGTFSPDTETDHNSVGLIMAMDSTAANQFYGTSTLKESSIKKTDKLILLSALDTDGVQLPEPDATTDTLIIEGVTYDVVNVSPVEPGAIPLIHYVQVRK